MKNKPLFDKLVSRIVKTSSGCWEWQGAKGAAGYGNVWWEGKYLNAHRAMHLAVHGELTSKVFVCHSCDNHPCINPEHLFDGSQYDNMLDMTRKGRRAQGTIFAESIKRAWTPEKRLQRARVTGERMQQEHKERALAAGVPDDWKYCPTCATWKPLSDYHLNKARYDGVHARCKVCRSESC